MTLDYFASKAAALDLVDTPEWVSSKNKSLEAYNAVKTLRGKKANFIRRHSRKSEFRRKSDWQISGAELARTIDVKVQTIMHNSTYSEKLRTTLESVNRELDKEVIKRIKNAHERRSRGPIMRNKDELVAEVQALRAQVRELDAINAKEQVQEVAGMLSLPILKKLGWT